MNVFHRLPRFQFFYKTSELFSSSIALIFADVESTKKKEQFLSLMKTFFGRQHALVVSSYRMGLLFTLKALNFPPESRVLMSPITIADTVNSIRLSGLKSVMVDIDPDTHAISLDDLEKKVTSDCKVLLVTYLSGIVPDIKAYKDFAKKHNLFLIEDISQNMDALYDGRKIGSHGDVSIASLSCGKNISTLYGGLILSDDVKLMKDIALEAARKISRPRKSVLGYYLLNSLKVQLATSRPLFPLITFNLLKVLCWVKGSSPVDFEHDPKVRSNIFASSNPELRTNYPDDFYAPLNDWQVDLVQHQLEVVSSGTKKRRELARTLLENLSQKSLALVPESLKKLDENSFYHFPIYCNKQKPQLREHLFMRGIDNGSYGLNLCSEEKAFSFTDELPGAVTVKHDSLFLPLHEDYSHEQMKNLAAAVNSFFDSRVD